MPAHLFANTGDSALGCPESLRIWRYFARREAVIPVRTLARDRPSRLPRPSTGHLTRHRASHSQAMAIDIDFIDVFVGNDV